MRLCPDFRMKELSSAACWYLLLLVAVVRFQYKQVAQAQCSQRLKFLRSCMIERGCKFDQQIGRCWDRDGTSIAGMAVSSELQGFCAARVDKSQACKRWQAVLHTPGFCLLHNGELHIVDV